MEDIFTWYPAKQPPKRRFETENDLIFIAQLESGHVVSAEYDQKKRVFVAYCQRYDGAPGQLESGHMTPDLVDQSLSWEAEETEDVVQWMWLPKKNQTA